MKKILIISANALGDTYLSCSAIGPLKNHFGDATFDLVTIKDSEIFLPYTEFDNVFYIGKRGASELFKAKAFLNSGEYDYVFSFFPGRMNTLLVMQSKSPEKYFYKNILKVEDWYRSTQIIYHNSDNSGLVWEPEMNYLDRIKLIVDAATGYDNRISKAVLGITPLENPVPGNPDVVINFSSREKSRALRTELVEDLSEYLSRVHSLKVRVLDFYGDLKNSRAKILFPPDYEFRTIFSEILNSKLFITVDSFLLHPAEASGANLLGVFGPTNPSSVLYPGAKNFVKNNPLKDIKIESIMPAIRSMLNIE